ADVRRRDPRFGGGVFEKVGWVKRSADPPIRFARTIGGSALRLTHPTIYKHRKHIMTKNFHPTRRQFFQLGGAAAVACAASTASSAKEAKSPARPAGKTLNLGV